MGVLYLAFDIAPKDIVRYCEITWAGRPVMSPKREMTLTGNGSSEFTWKSMLFEPLLQTSLRMMMMMMMMMMIHVITSFSSQLQQCMNWHGGHLQSIIFIYTNG